MEKVNGSYALIYDEASRKSGIAQDAPGKNLDNQPHNCPCIA